MLMAHLQSDQQEAIQHLADMELQEINLISHQLQAIQCLHRSERESCRIHNSSNNSWLRLANQILSFISKFRQILKLSFNFYLVQILLMLWEEKVEKEQIHQVQFE